MVTALLALQPVAARASNAITLRLYNKKSHPYRRLCTRFWQQSRQLSCCYWLWLALFQTCSLTLTTTQEEQPGPANFTHAYDFNFVDIRRQCWEDPLNAYTVRYFADGERFATAAWVPALNNRTRKYLNAFFISFADFDVHIHRVACPEGGQIGATLRVVCLH